MSRPDFTLEAMLRDIEDEIVVRKRLYGPAARTGSTHSNYKIDVLKAVANVLREKIMDQRPGASQIVRWRPVDPRSSWYARARYPVLLSYFGFDGSGNGRRYPYVMFAERVADAVRSPNVYAVADAPPPAQLPQETTDEISGRARPPGAT